MITLQHTLVTLLSSYDKQCDFKKVLPYALLPDAIRMYTGERQYSHFEKSADESDVSYMDYPESIADITKESVEADKESDQYHLCENIKPCCIGEDTDIDAFYAHNAHLPVNYHRGVELHLKQDICFDRFIRRQIDCSKKYDHEFIFRDKTLDDKGVRSLIADIEQWGVYVLAHDVYERKGVVTDQAWFDRNVKPLLDEAYNKDMADNTYKYMKIRPDINDLIANKDWSYLDRMLFSYQTYENLYADTLSSCERHIVNRSVSLDMNAYLDESLCLQKDESHCFYVNDPRM